MNKILLVMDILSADVFGIFKTRFIGRYIDDSADSILFLST